MFHVLNRINPEKCTLDGIDDPELESRSGKMIANAMNLGVPDLMAPSYFTQGNVKINTLFLSAVFNTNHGIESLTKEEYEAAAMIDDDIEGTKEERVFRFWINSLNIEGVYIDDLFSAFKDGILLNKVIHKINN